MALTTQMNFSLLSTLTNALDLGTAQLALAFNHPFSWASGTAINQADMIFADQRTLAASATEDLDVAGVLTNMLTGVAMTFARIKALGVYAAIANTNNVNVTRPASNGVPLFIAAGDGVAVRPGGMLVMIAPDVTGYLVTAATGDLITFTNSSGTTGVTYDVVIIGASA